MISGLNVFVESKGAIIEIPVVIIIPEVIPTQVDSYNLGVLDLKENERIRRFIVPPLGCTYIDACICDSRTPEANEHDAMVDDESSRVIVMHAVQLFAGVPYR